MNNVKYVFVGVISVILLTSIIVIVLEKPSAMYSISEKIEQSLGNITSSSTSYDWPMYQHDASHTGTSMSSFPDSLNQIWNRSYSNIIWAVVRHFSSPIVANDKVFIYGHFDSDPYGKSVFRTYEGAMITAFDENNGSQIWRRELIHLPLLSRRISFSGLNSPAYSNGKLFVSMGLGTYISRQREFFLRRCWSKLFALDENTGHTIWEKTFLGSSFHCSVIVAEGKVIAGGHLTFQIPLSMIYVYDENNGELIWRKSMLGFLESTPVVSDNKVFVVTGFHSGMFSLLERFYLKLFKKSRVYAFDINNGKRLWMKPVEGYVLFSSPAAGDGKLFIPSNIIVNKYRYDRRIYALDQETGEEIWYHTIEQKYVANWLTSISTPSLAYGKLFVVDADGWLYALDEDNGNIVWEREIIEDYSDCLLFAHPVISPVVVDSKVIAHAQRAPFTIYTCIFNESNGKLIWRMRTSHDSSATGPFAVADGKLFVNSDFDVIYVYG
ncbi:MAG: PQQ-binding-like beta-propeller repeat protein [Candidatus Thermoplasmatota archaeon]|jgi:outer membrane protein assembly factor BamB|nr:PQQ-binding-like beta-propeller repeat protein [Candidatus Thermoplasmatota archaeon]